MPAVGLTMRSTAGAPGVPFGRPRRRGLAPPTEQRRRRGLVDPTQWRPDDQPPRRLPCTRLCGRGTVDDHPGVPTWRLLGLVAPGALAVALGVAGRATVAERGGMVGVRDRRAAVRRRAQVVAEHEHPAEQPGEDAAAGVHRDQVPPVRRGVEPPQPDPGGLTTGVGAVELAAKPPSSDRRREAAVTGDAGRLPDGPSRVPGAEQRPVGHHQVKLHGLQPTALAPGQNAQRRVGSHRPHPAPQVRLLRRVAGGHRAGAGGQRRVRAGHLRHGPEDT